ncbi:hypothetical protein [Corynebacterium rouxii]|uniref:Uncharacterized protein n=1 Tax=Corynebacterium rouxii TaxID=2719119 RepID=A0ABU3PM92_9CORY|nr:hypothetical protein [Corynebacterium rouxii]MDT9408274.1 hypothetical protein [Corynebacterium rouxii]MDT9410453.1 hypothetical protein [Corynebacterium rouxii]
MTSPDPTTIPTILRLVEDIWQGQPNLSLVAILDILRNHGLDWDSTPADTLAILRSYLDDYPTALSEDTLASGRTYRIRTTSPTVEFIICGHRIAALGNAPTTWKFEQITRAEIHQPLRIDAHRYGVITHIDNLGDLTPATATRLLVTLAPTLHDAPTLVLSNASTRKITAYTTKNRRKESTILSGKLINYAIGGRCVVASPSGEIVDLGEVVSVVPVG